jgi:phosphatidate cytidylyltransferase
MTAPEAPPAPAPEPRRRSDLPARLATAAIGIPALLLVIVAGGPLYTAVVALVLGVATAEIYRAAGLRLEDPAAFVGVAAAAAMAPAVHATAEVRVAILTGLVVVSLAVLVVNGEVGASFERWTPVVAGAVYIGVLGSHLVALRRLDDGRDWVLLMLFTTFATDTGAYFIGRAIGRHRLAPRVSPGKTIEGAVGGLIAAALASVALNAALSLGQQTAAMLALGAAVGVAGQLGDLAESLLKRSLGVKDMGRLFPGHGGVLDRMDSILFATPLVYYLARFVMPAAG